jgi:hypothetical protein
LALLIPFILSSQAPQSPAPCADPAIPLVELARTYKFPPPHGSKAESAYRDMMKYFAKPNPTSYHNRLADYKWLEQMSTPDLHITMALGILYASGPDINFPGSVGYRHNMVANNALADDAAARALVSAIEQDPSQWLAAVGLARVSLVSPEPDRRVQAIAAVKRAMEYDPENVALQLAWHDLLVIEEKTQESLDFVRAHPHACAAVKHALAESLLLTGDTAAGAKLYIEALKNAGPDELHRFRDDMRVAASIGQLKKYEATPPAKRAAWILDFWQYSATSFARSLEARISEQMIRAAYADVHFRRRETVVSSDDPNWMTDTSHVVPWDTRGVTYVRHGAPLRRFRVLNQCFEPYEAWVYSAEDQPWIFWFKRNCLSPESGGARGDDWYPTFGPPLCGSPFLPRPVPTLAEAKAKLEAHPEEIDRRDIYTLLSEYDTRYNDMLHECAKEALGVPTRTAQLLSTDFQREGVRLFNGAQWQESAGHQLENRVRLVVAAYEFQNAQHHSEIAALSWIPVADLSKGGTTATEMQFNYIIAEADTSMIATRVDGSTTVPARANVNGILHNVVMIPDVKTGSSTMRVIALDAADTTRGGIRTAPLNVRGYPSPQGMSDIVLAIPDLAGILQRGSFSIEPLPGHIADFGQQFRVFFEVYGAEKGADVKTTLSVTRTDQSALQQLRSLFPGKVASRTLSFDRKAELDERGVFVEDVLLSGDFVPGQYVVEVTISFGGRKYTRHTGLTIIK